jgi:hypothetical protein
MSLGKYSPTVTYSYKLNQQWFKEYAKSAQYDPEGYDSYGYNAFGLDRAKNYESDYRQGNALADLADLDFYAYVESFYQIDLSKNRQSLGMLDMSLEDSVKALEELSNPDENSITITRDRVGNWRVMIDYLFTNKMVSERDESLKVAIQKALTVLKGDSAVR